MYDYASVLQLVLSGGFYRCHHPQLDLVSAVEIVGQNLLGVKVWASYAIIKAKRCHSGETCEYEL